MSAPSLDEESDITMMRNQLSFIILNSTTKPHYVLFFVHLYQIFLFNERHLYICILKPLPILYSLVFEEQLNISTVPTATSNARFGEGLGPIWLDDVACRGTEVSLRSCRHNGVGNHNCEHHEDAGVICYGKPRMNVELYVTYSNTQLDYFCS